MREQTRTDAPNRPERGADRNRRALATDDADADPVLPSLDDGVTLLEVDGRGVPVLPSLDDGVTLLEVDGRGVPVLQSLALDHLLVASGPAYWVDTAGCARTTTLARVAPSWRLLERVQVSRGFTPYQHHAAVADVPDTVATGVRDAHADRDGAPETPALLVAPVVDGRYRDADDLPREHARRLLSRTLARLRRYADAYDAPVLLTRTTDSEFGNIVSRAADHRLRCERTAQGPRFVGDEQTETLVYPQPDGTLQTTLAYWRTVLENRASAAGVSVDDPAPIPTGTSAVGPTDAGSSTGAADTHGHGVAHERALSPWRGGV